MSIFEFVCKLRVHLCLFMCWFERGKLVCPFHSRGNVVERLIVTTQSKTKLVYAAPSRFYIKAIDR